MNRQSLQNRSSLFSTRAYFSLWSLGVCFIFLTLFLALSCSESSEIASGSTEKIFDEYSSDPYLDSSNAFDDGNSQWGISESEQSVIDEFLAQYIGEPEYGDLTDGEVLVAGPGSSVQVAIGCREGSLYVVAGAFTGALATLVAGSGLFAAGVGVAGTSTASVPLYAAAGGMIGLAASAPSWTECFGSLAYLGLTLIQEGYFSVARGLQSVLRKPSRNQSYAGTNTASAECQGGGSKCRQMNNRYHSYCNPLEEANTYLTGAWNGDLCKSDLFFTNFSCDDLYRMVQDAAGCEAGRRLVTNRCYGGQWDANHIPPWKNAEKLLRQCSDLYMRRCGNVPSENQLKSDAENQYPECR